MNNKYELQSNIKSSGTAYLFFLFLGAHYAYMGKWGLQLLYWFTLGGFFIWMFIDLFRIGGMVSSHNALIYRELEVIEQREKNDEQTRQMAMISAARG